MTSAYELHDNGVHTKCTPPAKKTGGAVGIKPKYQDGGHAGWCLKAGTVEAYHGHDFDGPLWDACGCEEFGDDE